MGRIYTVPFGGTASPAAAFDAFEVLAASAKPFILHEIVLGQSSDMGDAAAEGLVVTIKHATGSYTSGSGGSTVTPTKDTNTASAGPTAEVMNTTQASAGSGALTTIRTEAWNIQGPFQYFPAPEQRRTFLPTEAVVVSVSAPTDAITMTGTLVFEEL